MNNPYGITKRGWETLLKTFAEFPKIEQVILFGSRSRGAYTLASDVDIALVGTGLSSTDATRISRTLNEERPIIHKMDVLILDILTNEVLRKFIERDGKVIYQRDAHSAG